MKTDSIFHGFFLQFPEAGEVLLKEQEITYAYTFRSVEIKEQAFRLGGIFAPADESLPIRFLEVQFQKDFDFYTRFFGEIFLYLRQHKSENDWQAVALFPSAQLDPGEQPHYREFFDSGRLRRIYLDELPASVVDRFPVNVLKIILVPEHKVREGAEGLIKRVPSMVPDQKRQRAYVELLIGMLRQKLKHISQEQVMKMTAPILSDIRASRLYREIAEEGRREGLAIGIKKGFEQGIEKGIKVLKRE